MQIQLATFLLLAFVGNARSQFSGCLTVEAKVYCQNIARRTWEQARMFCEINNMKLATIETEPENDALNDAFGTIFYGDYWIAARDVQGYEQFVWHLPATPQVDSRVADFVEPPELIDFQTCLTYSIRKDKKSGFKLMPCRNGTVTLCEGPAPTTEPPTLPSTQF